MLRVYLWLLHFMIYKFHLVVHQARFLWEEKHLSQFLKEEYKTFRRKGVDKCVISKISVLSKDLSYHMSVKL